MKPLFVDAVGIAAGGLPDWAAAATVLRGEAPYAYADLPAHAPALLSANERRRATATVRLAFRAAEDAIATSRFGAHQLATVFSSSEADTPVMHRICSALATPQRLVSPTDFHNSVHNAAAGYWSIAAGCRAPSISLSAWDAGFAAGLLEAAALAEIDGHDVLLVAYDVPAPEPLHQKRPLSCSFGVAMVLTPNPGYGHRIDLHLLDAQASESRMQDPALEALRVGNPAARALPLLQLLAQRRAGAVTLPGSGHSRLRISVAPA